MIDSGFKKAFLELIFKLAKSSDQEKLKSIKLNEIKGMIETFSIQEEKFINQVYFVTLGFLLIKERFFIIWKKEIYILHKLK